MKNTKRVDMSLILIWVKKKNYYFFFFIIFFFFFWKGLFKTLNVGSIIGIIGIALFFASSLLYYFDIRGQLIWMSYVALVFFVVTKFHFLFYYFIILLFLLFL